MEVTLDPAPFRPASTGPKPPGGRNYYTQPSTLSGEKSGGIVMEGWYNTYYLSLFSPIQAVTYATWVIIWQFQACVYAMQASYVIKPLTSFHLMCLNMLNVDS